jgi:hypothetical protein
MMVDSIGLLAREIVSLAADMEAAMCRWLGLLGEFDAREGWAEEGCSSCAQWVAWKCGLGGEAARERVRMARRLREMPEVRQAFSRAELTYSKVRALTRVENVKLEADLVELARNTTASQLERVVSAANGCVRQTRDAQATHDARSLGWSIADDGSWLIRARLPADQGALLVKAVESMRDELDRSVSAETSEPATWEPLHARNADALVEICSGALAGQAAGSNGGDRFQVVVHVDAATLTEEDPDDIERCDLEHGPVIAVETARRLACDASLIRITEQDGKPLSVGRKTRSIPPALRRALKTRDGCCQFPGCERTRHTDAHHVEHWARGGRTALANLVTLCRFHHHLVHEGGYSVAREGDRFAFVTPDGRRLDPAPRAQVTRAPLPSVSAETLQRMYEALDLDLAVEAVFNAAPPPQPGEEALE